MCRPGVLIYKVDADVDAGMGPVTVYDSPPGQRRLHPQPERPRRTLGRRLHPGRDLQGPTPNITIAVCRGG
ncbi:hypothetical protein LV779_16940 [Streptomyces thinghirensis]|nr:hypothetical protein [Streptomyces thinghirensis]